MSRLALCPVCGKSPSMAGGNLVMCLCGVCARTINTWNRLARLAEVGRLVEMMPIYSNIQTTETGWFIAVNGAVLLRKTALSALRAAARAGKWKIR